MRRYLIELIGTFVVVLTAVVTLARGEPLAALAIGAVLGAVLALSPEAGPRVHLNPAVSLGATLHGRLPAAELAPYLAAQLSGALAGAALAMWVTEVPAGGGLSTEQMLQTGAVELGFAFVLALVALSTRVESYPVAVGLVMTAGLIVAIPISGGALNPAIAFGQAVSGLGAWSSVWVLLVATSVGGALAGLVAGQLSSRPG